MFFVHSDKSTVKRGSFAIASLGVAAFWGGLIMAAGRYPSDYDWRYMSVSKLVEPDRNPAGYLWASMGILLCSFCGLCWMSILTRRRDYAVSPPGGIKALQFGYICMICAVVLLPWPPLIPKEHEIIAVLAFAGLLIGMVHMMFWTVERTLLKQIREGGHARLYAFMVAGIAVFPIVLAGLAQAYFYYVPTEHHWIFFLWRVREWPVLLRFPFWEWVTCAVLSVYMILLPLATARLIGKVENHVTK
jgi:hypothetical protein